MAGWERGVANGAMGMGALAATMVASAAVAGMQDMVANADRRQAHAYAAGTVEAWQRALAAEQAKSARLLAACRDLQAEADELDSALADASTENEALREEVAALRRQAIRRVA